MLKTHLSRLSAAALFAAGTLAAMPAMAGKTIDAIKARGQMICGVNPACPASPPPTARACGRAWTWTSARPSPPPS